MSGRRRAVLGVLAGLGLLLLAFGLRYSAPGSAEREAPFLRVAELGERVDARHVELRVLGVRAAREVELDGWDGETAGLWLVVDAELAASRERISVDARLRLDGREWRASDRPGLGALDGNVADAGLPKRGPILFEIAADALDSGSGEALLLLASSGDPRLDEVVAVRIDLDGVEPVPVLLLEPPERTAW